MRLILKLDPAFTRTSNGTSRLFLQIGWETSAIFINTGTTLTLGRQIVDVAKCRNYHGTLTLHGNNRTDEPQVCVICHNPNNTGIAYRQAAVGPEAPIDLKSMVHAIHAAKVRDTPFIVIGRNHSVNDFSHVEFPGELRNCLKCHIDRTFELPLGSNVLGTTVQTQSVLGGAVDTDPANDRKITPTAAVCSSCHDVRGCNRRSMRAQ
jgi:OmcA/MtrC family decaheme c-type cytochrome